MDPDFFIGLFYGFRHVALDLVDVFPNLVQDIERCANDSDMHDVNPQGKDVGLARGRPRVPGTVRLGNQNFGL